MASGTTQEVQTARVPSNGEHVARTVQVQGRPHVNCDNCGPGFAGYAGAFGGLGSLLLAIVATVIALQSRRDSKRSADSAEAALDMQRKEHNAFMEDRRRAPLLTLQVGTNVLECRRGAYVVKLDVRVTNVGNRVADATFLGISVPADVRLELCDVDGNRLAAPLEMMTDNKPLEPGGEPVAIRRYGKEPFDIPPTLQYAEYLRMVLPGPGRYPVHVLAAHPALPDTDAYEVVVLVDSESRQVTGR